LKPEELLLSQKAGLVVYWLMLGEGLRIFQVAELTGLTNRQAYTLLCHLSQNIPIYCDKGVWQMLDGTEE